MWDFGKKGFTLIELSLSLVFISILSVTIVLITNNAISTYRRGLVLKQINTTGIDLTNDIRTTIQNSPTAPVTEKCSEYELEDTENCEIDGAEKFVEIKQFAIVKDVGEEVPVYGAFCTGRYSYIWNSGYFYTNEYIKNPNNYIVLDNESLSPAKLKLSDGTEMSSRLLKVKDADRSVCALALGEEYAAGKINNVFEVNEMQDEEPVEVLTDDSANQLALYDLSAEAVNGPGDVFYSVSFVLGTIQGGVNVMSGGDFCVPPKDFESSLKNFDYCAINKFNFAAQATGS